MKIKTKLLLGFGLLFLVVVFFGIVSIYYIEDISKYSKVTVTNNYETLTFTREMRAVLDENDLPLSASAGETFNNALKKQENNITERGEKEATAGVRAAFGQLTAAVLSLGKKQQAERTIRLGLTAIDGLNMKAIVQKNNYIHSTVSKATLYLGGIVFITFLILFVFIINFPGFILNPLNEFIEGVHELGQRHFNRRLEFKTSDEFAVLATEFNRMAASFSEWENNNLTKILSGENQVKILIEEIPDAVIGVNEEQELLFLNTAAKKIFNADEKVLTGWHIKDVVKNDNLLKAMLDGNDKAPHYKIKSMEIVVPNLKQAPIGTLQFSGFPAGMIYMLKNIEKTNLQS